MITTLFATLTAVLFVGLVVSIVFSRISKREYKREIEELKQLVHTQKHEYTMEIQRAHTETQLVENAWIPKFFHTDDRRGVFKALKLDDARVQQIKDKAVEMFAQYIQKDLKFTELLEQVFNVRSYTPVEKILLFEEVYMLYRLGSMTTSFIWEIKSSLLKLAMLKNPNHELTKFMAAENKQQRVVTSSGSLAELVRELIGDSMRPAPSSSTTGDTKEPEESIHAKAETESVKEEVTADPESRVSNL